MSVIAFAETGTQFEPFVSWYRKRPTQLAFAASLLVHALLIALMPGFRSVPPDTPAVLTVQLVDEQPRVDKTVVPEPAIRQEQMPPEPAPVVDEPAPVVEVPTPPQLVTPAPQPRPIDQTPVVARPVVQPQPQPLVQQPESPVATEPVARAELAPALPRERPQVKPVITSRPELAPDRPAVPVVEPQAKVEIEEPVKPVQVRRQPPVVRQAPSPSVPSPQVPPPAAAAPNVTPAQSKPPEVAAPAAPVPTTQPSPIKQAAPQKPSAVAPPVSAAVAKPGAPAPVAAPAPPAPPAPVVETVEPSVLEAYRQEVSREVMRHMSYPRIAIRRKWQGKAVVEMKLSDDGAVTQLVVVESSGKDVLDDAAVSMVRKSLPLPKPPRGVRSVKVPVVFRLQG